MVADPEDSRAELGRFLRARREQLRPEDLGFPSVRRRRTPGLRREEVAVAAGLSATWYTYLEQGRDRVVSPAVLDSLARVLRLTEDERRYMHFLMYGHQPRTEPLTDDIPIDRLIEGIVTATNDYPYPVYSVDRKCDLVAWNGAAAEWYDDWSKLPAEECNFALWLFRSGQAKQRFVDWEGVARSVVARWRANLVRRPEDPAAMQLVDALRDEFPLFDRWWNDGTVQEHRVAVRDFKHPRWGVCSLRIVPLFTVYDDAPSVFFHFPDNCSIGGVDSR